MSLYRVPEHHSFLVRARRAAETQTILEADRDDFLLWIFCVWCGHAGLRPARWLVARVKDPPNLLDELEQRLKCEKCRRRGIKLIPTDRTEISCDPMGLRARSSSQICECGWYATRSHNGRPCCERCFEEREQKEAPRPGRDDAGQPWRILFPDLEWKPPERDL